MSEHCEICELLAPKLGGHRTPVRYTAHTHEVLTRRPELVDMPQVGVTLARGAVEGC